MNALNDISLSFWDTYDCQQNEIKVVLLRNTLIINILQKLIFLAHTLLLLSLETALGGNIMKKTVFWIIIFVLSAAVMVVVTEARETENTFETNSAAYVPPTLENSILPEPVYYTPDRYVEGYVTVELKVGPEGNVEGVTVLYRTSQLAVKSAITAIEKWTFKPATLSGQPVTAYVAYSVPFGRNLQIFANENYADRILDPVSGDQIAMK